MSTTSITASQSGGSASVVILVGRVLLAAMFVLAGCISELKNGGRAFADLIPVVNIQ